MGKNGASTLREHIQVNFEHVQEKIFKTVDTVSGFPCNSSSALESRVKLLVFQSINMTAC